MLSRCLVVVSRQIVPLEARQVSSKEAIPTFFLTQKAAVALRDGEKLEQGSGLPRRALAELI